MRSQGETSRLKKLPRSFYLSPTLTVAKRLLGKRLVRRYKGTELIGRIVETEAYRGVVDPASHAYRGKTARNEVMFRKGGHLYVYFTYGMHFCANVVTREEEIGEAVLIRAIEPLEGIEVMMENRSGAHFHQRAGHHALANLTNGPAKLCQALAIRRDENGTDLLGDEIFLLNSPALTSARIGRSRRIGITSGKEKRWRFFIRGNAWVSR
jgi:DNA-3-methyladenine glycosylase